MAGAGPLERAMRVRQLLTTARGALEETHPGDVSRVARRALAFSYLLRKFSLTPAALDEPPAARVVAFHTFKALSVVLVGLPISILGVLAWWVPYRLTGAIANRVSGTRGEKDQISLHKLLAGCVLFPLFLVGWTLAAWLLAGPLWAAAAFVLLPLAGISSLLFLEYASWREGQLRDVLALALAPGSIGRLRARRDALVAECDRLAAAFTDNPVR